MEKEVLIKEFSIALQKHRGVYFVGAGISKPSGFKDWLELLKTLENDIGIEIKNTDDLTEIAQYIVNENMENRGRLLKVIEENYAVPETIQTNSYHKYLAQTNVSTIWTTNYDVMLEKSMKGQVRVKRCDNDLLPSYNDNGDVEIIKMHGCIESPSPENIVITKEDYEDYAINHPLTIERLRSDLINKSFLFIGYSYRDPNIRTIMNEVRHLCKKKTTPHYMVLEAEKDPRLMKIQELWCKDLLRYGINTYVYPYGQYYELEEILKSISMKSKGNTVYVTGTHKPKSKESILMAERLGVELAKLDDVTLINGQSEGIAQATLQAFLDHGIKEKKDIYNRLKIYPNPFANNKDWDNKDEYLSELRKFRTSLIKNTQILILFHGCKATKLEYELAVENGCFIVPVYISENDTLIKDIMKNKYVIDSIRRYDVNYAQKLEQEELVSIEDIIMCIRNILDI